MDNKKELDTFCANIRYLRQQRQLSQKEMAALLHISVDYVRRLERGEVPPRMTLEPAIYCYYIFGFSLDVLLHVRLAEIE